MNEMLIHLYHKSISYQTENNSISTRWISVNQKISLTKITIKQFKMFPFCDQYRANNTTSSTELVDNSYRIEWIQEFGSWYKSIHGYTSIIVCLFGSILNIWNLFILSKKEMRTATNILLIALAVADLLNMLEYIPFVTYMKLWPYKSNGLSEKTYSWAVFVLVHSIFSQVRSNFQLKNLNA